MVVRLASSVPDVANADDVARGGCRLQVRAAGQRSSSSSLPHFGYQSVPVVEARKALNDNTLLIVMIESGAALECVEDIAAVPA
jgi:2-keto-3-deoxy-L-rhamnonate aldolase RhmA